MSTEKEVRMLSDKSIQELEILSSQEEFNYLFQTLNKPFTEQEKKVADVISRIIIRECHLEQKHHAFVRSMIHMASKNCEGKK